MFVHVSWTSVQWSADRSVLFLFTDVGLIYPVLSKRFLHEKDG